MVESEKSGIFSDNSKKIQRLLKRAADRSLREQKKQINASSRIGKKLKSSTNAGKRIANAFAKALKASRPKSKKSASVRIKAPDTGGRSFHFEHSTVSPKSADTKNTGRRRQQATRGSAHMAYIEREDAIERLINLAIEKDQSKDILENEKEIDITSESMQAYIERPGALENKIPDFSFGNIADTKEERLAFWDLVEEHAKGNKSVIQHRVILGLPHEVSGQTRLAIMKAYTKRFEEQGIPYWTVLHAPTTKNDSRNFHAHLVYLTRPAKIILHPEGGDDGKLINDQPKRLVPTWDFAAFTHLPDKNKHRRIQYPHRQESTERDINHVVNERKRFSGTVNAELIKVGSPIRYDPRSYKDMGIDTKAIGSMSLKVLDQVRSGKRTLEDSGQTKRMMENIVQQATQKSVIIIQKLKKELKKLPDLQKTRKSLRKRVLEFQKSSYQGSALAEPDSEEILKNKHKIIIAKEKLALEEIKAKIETTRLEHVIEMTNPDYFVQVARHLKKESNQSKKSENFRNKQNLSLPHIGTLKIIHEEANKELGYHLKSITRRRKNTAIRVKIMETKNQSSLYEMSSSQALQKQYQLVVRLGEQQGNEMKARAKARAIVDKKIKQQLDPLLNSNLLISPDDYPIAGFRPLNPMVASIQKYIMETTKDGQEESYERMHKGLLEIAQSYNRLLKNDKIKRKIVNPVFQAYESDINAVNNTLKKTSVVNDKTNINNEISNVKNIKDISNENIKTNNQNKIEIKIKTDKTVDQNDKIETQMQNQDVASENVETKKPIEKKVKRNKKSAAQQRAILARKGFIR